jgi:hypothetical protein
MVHQEVQEIQELAVSKWIKPEPVKQVLVHGSSGNTGVSGSKWFIRKYRSGGSVSSGLGKWYIRKFRKYS